MVRCEVVTLGLVELLALAGVSAVPIALVGGLIAWGVHSHKKRQQVWASVAQRLGLHYANYQIYGHLDGSAVRLFTEVRGSGKNKQTYTVAAGMIVPGFDLGLAIYKHGFFQSIGQAMGMTDIQIGDPGFDQAFVIKGDEPHRVKALLASDDLRRALAQVHASNWVFTVRDEGFRVECRGATSDPQWLEWALRASAQLARLLSDARANIPCASSLAKHRDVWVQYAQASGLAGMDTPLCMYGRHEGASISVYAVRSGPLQYGVEVLVKFDQPLTLGLHVRPQSGWDAIGAFLGGQDLKIGDATFDPVFVVKARSQESLGIVLDAEVRAKMMDLQSRVGVIQVRDDGVTLRAPRFSEDPAGVPWLVAQARQLSDRIADNASRIGVATAGPYR